MEQVVPQRPEDEFSHQKTQVVIRLRLSEQGLRAVQTQLDLGWLFLPAQQPCPPGTRLAFMLQDDRGHLTHSGEGVVVAWQTLLTAQETGEPPGMRVRVDRLDGRELDKATSEEIARVELKDASEALADQIDLDADDEPTEPVPLPAVRTAKATRIDFHDIAALLGDQIDLEDLGRADLPAVAGAEPAPAGPPARPPRPAPGRARRRDARVTVSIPVRAQTVPSGKAFDAVAWNLSAGGLFLRTSESLPLMGLLDLELHLPGLDEPVHQAAKVVRVQPLSEHGSSPRMAGLGLQFIDPSDELRRRIAEHVERCRVRAQELAAQRVAALPVQADALAAPAPPPEQEPALQPETVPEPGAEPVPAAAAGPELSPAQQKRLVVDSLVAALDLSGVEDFEDNETIRYLLEVWYLKYFQAGTVDLTLLWNTLAADEGIDAVQAALPVFIFAMARGDHGLDIKLPEGLKHFDGYGQTLERARRQLAEEGAFRAAYDRVGRRSAEAAKARRTARAERAKAHVERKERKQKKAKARRDKLQPWPRKPGRRSRKAADAPLVTRQRAVIAAVALVTCLVSYFVFKPSRAVYFDPAILNDTLQLDKALVQGSHLQAVVTDQRWRDISPAERREVLLELLGKLEAQGITSALLFDDKLRVTGVVRAAPGIHLQPIVRVGPDVLTRPVDEDRDELP